MYQRNETPLREIGPSTTLSLPNIRLSGGKSVPQIQVSSEADSTECSTRSKAFWDETTQLLQALSVLRDDVADIACPCSKAKCPFRHDGGRKSTLKSRNAEYMMTAGMDGYLSRHNVATYLASIQPANGPVSADALLRQDCQVTEEPLARHGEVYFVRNCASRKAQRRNSTIRVSASYPVTMNCLMVPSSQGELCHSLPNIYNSPLQLGSGLDSLDSEKMQDIQKSFLRGQQRHMSNIDLVQL